MSGHSKWAKVHRQKTITDAKKGAVFTKLGNLITVAAKEGGEDIETNFKLRLAVEKARQANMPKDNIDRAIKKGAGLSTGKTALAEITYEAFGPSGSVFVIEAITDNKNRTVADLKAVLIKNGGQLGGPNSTLWQFERKGLILIDKNQLKNKNTDDLELDLIEAGAENINQDENSWEITTAANHWPTMEKNIKQLNINIKESSLGYKPKDYLDIKEEETKEKIDKLYTALIDIDEINNIYTNANW